MNLLSRNHVKLFRWVPIKGNDWYWIRHHIKVGMQVIVEILVRLLLYYLVFIDFLSFFNSFILYLTF